jgi:pyruvate-ferredoxin/flavodoxin oxidoreductase
MLVCPHAVIRTKVYDKKFIENPPPTFQYSKARGREWPEDSYYTIQVAPEDCTGCELCCEICPAKNKKEAGLKALNMRPQIPLRAQEKENWEFFLGLPEVDRKLIKVDTVKGSQFLQPLFEFSGACAGCGETPYIKLASQLFGDRMIAANATGCSSIYGGNLPTTPWTFNSEGKGPAWSNSLFEDNAEFGLGFRLTIDQQTEHARTLLQELAGGVGKELAADLLNADQSDEAGIHEQRERVRTLNAKLENMDSLEAKLLLSLSDFLVKKSVWIIGGDGWAYDIGYGGLDHVIASNRNVNLLVLDTEVYSNTGGQMSKATPLGGVAKFAAAGKPLPKKDIVLQAISYGYVYVATVAMGANDTQTVKAFIEAENYDGPSLIIAYSHCIAHGINMKFGLTQQQLAVDSGYWPLLRFNPDKIKTGENPLRLDSKPPRIPFREYAYNETRYKMLLKSMPDRAKHLMDLAQEEVNKRWRTYEHMAKYVFNPESEEKSQQRDDTAGKPKDDKISSPAMNMKDAASQ